MDAKGGDFFAASRNNRHGTVSLMTTATVLTVRRRGTIVVAAAVFEEEHRASNGIARPVFHAARAQGCGSSAATTTVRAHRFPGRPRLVRAVLRVVPREQRPRRWSPDTRTADAPRRPDDPRPPQER